MSKEKFLVLMTLLFDSKLKKFEKTVLDTWYLLFKKYPENLLEKAFHKMIISSEEFPSVGKIIEIINQIQKGSSDEEAELQWQAVLESASSGGNIPISAKAAKAVNSLGGLWTIRMSTTKEIIWIRKTFLEIYKNIPDEIDNNFRCFGLNAKILPAQQKMEKLNGQ